MTYLNSRFLVLSALTLLPIFASALLAPAFFAPIRVPVYLVAIFLTLIMMTKRTYRFIFTPAIYGAVFFILYLASAALNSLLDSPVVYRQLLNHAALFFCVYIGYVCVRMANRWKINYIRYLAILFVFLFAYGIYTYYAQIYELPELLWFLRPSPAVRLIEADKIYTQSFHGALSRYRAYSVWYEPSFASLVLACSLPLLWLVKGTRLSIILVATSLGYAVLTYSRSAWLICLVFIIFYFLLGFKRRRVSTLVFATIFVLSIPISILAGLVSTIAFPDVSALVRFYNSVQGIAELQSKPWAWAIGLGTPDLVSPPFFEGGESRFITNAFIGILHWLGVAGLLFLCAPFVILLKKARRCELAVYQAVVCFVFLTVIALGLGGDFMGLSLLWFFVGFYYALAESKVAVPVRHATKVSNDLPG